MPEYVKKSFRRLQHPKPKIPKYAPHLWIVSSYGKRPQLVPDPYERKLLDKKVTKRIQYIVETLLYYAHSVYPKMLRPTNEISRFQSKPTKYAEEKAKLLLDYTSTYPNVVICYRASDMVLQVDSDAAYITMIEEISCYAEHLYLSDWPSPWTLKHTPRTNGPIHTECKTIRNVVSSSEEVETCGTFNNLKTAIGIKPDLITLEHNQPATPLKTDN